MGAALADGDAVRDQRGLRLHPAGLGKRAARGRGQGVEPGHLVGAIERVDGDDEEVGKDADDRQDQRYHQNGAPPWGPRA